MKKILFGLVFLWIIALSFTNYSFADNHAFGDSFTVGNGASDMDTTAYLPIFKEAKSWTVTNHAVGGDMIPDQADDIYAINPNIGDNFIYFLGVNDQWHYSNANQLVIYEKGSLAELAWLGILPSNNKLTGKSELVTKSGTWSDTEFYGIGKVSNTNGDTLTASICGKNILIGYDIKDNNGGQFNVTVDGVNKGAFNNYIAGTINSYHNIDYAPQLIVITDLTDSVHEIVITVSSATSASNKVYIDWISGINEVEQKDGVNIFVLNIPRQAYNYPAGGSDEHLATLNDALSDNVYLLKSWGININLCDVRNSLNQTSDLYQDGIHPNDSGHAKLAQELIYLVNKVLPTVIIPEEEQGATPGYIYPPAYNSTYIKATTSYSPAYGTTDPEQSLTGTYVNTWSSAYSINTNQRFHIDLGSAKTVTQVYYENQHASGGYTTMGANHFSMWGSNDSNAFNELTYSSDTGWTQLTTSISQLVEHTASDSVDPHTFTVTNTTAYRYYAFKFADNWGYANQVGIRRIELYGN